MEDDQFDEPLPPLAGVSPWWYVPGYNDWEQAIIKELTPCWSCERNADAAARTVAPIINELLKQRPKTF